MGYILKGSLLCDDGEWWGDAECVPRNCIQTPEVRFQGPMHRCRGMADGGQCALHCQPGYVPMHALSENLGGSQSIFEQKNTTKTNVKQSVPLLLCDRGRWSGAVCVPAPCV